MANVRAYVLMCLALGYRSQPFHYMRSEETAKPYYNVVKVVGGRAKRLAGSLAKMATDTNVPYTGASTLHCTEKL